MQVFKNHKTLFYILTGCLLLIPPAVCFLFIYKFGVNEFWGAGDEFKLFGLFELAQNHNLSFGALFALHNEHRILFHRLLALANMYLFGYNSKIMMYCSFFFMFSGWILLLKYVKDLQKPIVLKFISALLISILCFNLRPWENLLCGFQTAWLLIFLCVIASAFLLQKALATDTGNGHYFITLIIFSVIASFSSAHGLFLWPSVIFVFVLMFISREKFSRKMFAIILAVGVAVFLLYFLGYNPQQDQQKSNFDLIQYIIFSIASIVNALYWTKDMFLASAACFIAVLLISAVTAQVVFLTYKKKIKENIFPIILICFSFIFILSIAVGRAKYGLGAASASRYINFTSMFFIGAILLFLQNMTERTKKYFIVLSVIFLCVLPFTQIKAWQYGDRIFKTRIQIISEVKDFDILKDKNKGVWRHDDEQLERIRLIETHKMTELFKNGNK